MVRRLLVGCMLLAFGAAYAYAAAPTPAARAEIEQLFAYLGKSGCEFFRNGDWHSAADARLHLKRKYDGLVQAGQIATAEDFIARGASMSSASGKPYLVRCSGGASEPSARWLTDELQRIRQAGSKK